MGPQINRRELIAQLNQTIGFEALIEELEKPQKVELERLVEMARNTKGEFTDNQLAAAFRAWASAYHMVQLIKRLPSQVAEEGE